MDTNYHRIQEYEQNNQTIQLLQQKNYEIMKIIEDDIKNQMYKLSRDGFLLQQEQLKTQNLKGTIPLNQLYQDDDISLYQKQIEELQKDLKLANKNILTLKNENSKIRKEQEEKQRDVNSSADHYALTLKHKTELIQDLKRNQTTQQKQIDELLKYNRKLQNDLLNSNNRVQYYSSLLQFKIGEEELKKYDLAKRWQTQEIDTPKLIQKNFFDRPSAQTLRNHSDSTSIDSTPSQRSVLLYVEQAKIPSGRSGPLRNAGESLAQNSK